MKCTILIFNYESLPYLRIAINQIRKHRHPLIDQHIIISEQSSDRVYAKVISEFGADPDITIAPMRQTCSGYAIDYVLRFIPIDTEFFCTLDVDAFPIHDNWLYTSIKLLQDHELTFVGLHSQIERWYMENQGRTQPFFIMGPCYSVGRTADYKDLAMKEGYTKHFDRHKINGLFDFSHETWGQGYSDDGVAANWYEDTQFNHKKFSYGVTGRMGVTPKEGEYGRVIGNIVMHICFSFTASLHGDNIESAFGREYLDWVKRIEALTPDQAVKEMLAAVQYMSTLQPMEYWSDWKIQPIPEAILQDIKELTK